MGKAMMGTGESEGEHRALKAAEAAIANPLLEDISMRGAQGVLINITGGGDMTLFEVDEAANRIRDEVATEANIIFGSTFDEQLEGKMRVSVVATGIDSEEGVLNKPVAPRSIPMTRPKVVVNTVREETQPEPAPAVETAVSEAEEIVAEVENDDGVEVAMDRSEAMETETADLAEDQVSVSDGDVMDTDDSTETDEADDAGEPAAEEPGLFGTIAETPTEPVAVKSATEETATVRKPPEVTIPRDAFRPPAPAMPEETSANGKGIDPFGEADLANGRAETGRRSRSNIFRRVTNLMGGAKDSADGSTEQNKVVPAPSAPQAKEPEPVTAVKATQQTLPAPNPEDRAAPSKADEEMLEIPAFLRRQAN